jgi:hypothetical protein
VPSPSEQVRYIALTGGLFAIVDAADFEWLNKYTWRAEGGTEGYALATIKGKGVRMHRLIMNAPAGMVVDHVNGNRRDNRRGNLRVCTPVDNSRNRRGFGRTSRFKGVYRDGRTGKWLARICLKYKQIHIGCFNDEVEAARAYDRKARELFGAFAYLNFPDWRRIVLVSGRITVHSRVRGNIQTVATSHRQGVAPCRCHPSESETNSNDQNSKFKTPPGRRFRSLDHLGFGHCLGIRNSCFGIGRASAWAIAHPTDYGEPWLSRSRATATGPPGSGVGGW